ncbi:thermostable hemolysin [Halomonas beimenensis]|uniref:Thermostable hemolysin delta-VPH n=1 Tax=Halomonas beimenensis TaxID=475662 RepID=A0A291PCE3_9GAMM|nr:thermostable hemolysin [Halomonas beimenensis]ATJ84538.1 hypothetical protein BEI_3551 [Halomonas beimenensis]
MPAPASHDRPAPPLTWREARHGSDRQRLERLIQACFANEHHARITRFLPRLFGLWQGDTPLAAVGVKRAERTPLFQEGYLDAPAETCLSRALGVPVARREIVEIGNLASTRHGLQRHLFLHLIDQLASEGLRWVLFTAIPTVINGIRRLGIELLPLRIADPAWLGEERADWGHYYDRHPWVMAGDLQLARERLRAAGLLPASMDSEPAHARPA